MSRDEAGRLTMATVGLIAGMALGYIAGEAVGRRAELATHCGPCDGGNRRCGPYVCTDKGWRFGYQPMGPGR